MRREHAAQLPVAAKLAPHARECYTVAALDAANMLKRANVSDIYCL